MARVAWPEDGKIEALVRERGQEGAARQLGVPRTTLMSHLERRGLAKTKTPAVPSEVSEEEILRERVGELERAQRQQRKLDVRDERIVRMFEQALAETKPRYTPPTGASPASGGGHEHILLLSDLHANEVVAEEETMGINAYNWTIMLKRLARIQRAVLSFQEHRPYSIQKLNVFMLGDQVSGTIHDDLANTNEMPHEHSVVQLGYDLSGWLDAFRPHYRSIGVAGVVGNHPRRSKRPPSKAVTDNSDWTVYKFIECYFRKAEGIDFHFPQAKFATVTVAKRWRALLLHGDGIRSTMIDVPFGGIIRYSHKLEAQFQKAGQPLDFICAGHWHTPNAIEGISTKLFINGSTKGVDEYSLQRFGGGRPPSQLLLTAHPKRGITEMQWLDCTDTSPNAER